MSTMLVRELIHETLWQLVGYGVIDLEDGHRIDSVGYPAPSGLSFSRAQQYACDHTAQGSTDTGHNCYRRGSRSTEDHFRRRGEQLGREVGRHPTGVVRRYCGTPLASLGRRPVLPWTRPATWCTPSPIDGSMGEDMACCQCRRPCWARAYEDVPAWEGLVQGWLAVADRAVSRLSIERNGELRPHHAVTAEAVAVGDPVALWRPGRLGGLVAVGSVRSTEDTPASVLEPSAKAVVFDFGSISLSSPVPLKALRAAGLTAFTHSVRDTNRSYYRGDFGFVRLDLNREQWAELPRLQRAAADNPVGSIPWIVPPGTVVRRRRLHDVYGGSRSGAGGSSGTTPNTFLFVRTQPAPGMQSAPSWDGGVLSVPGCLQNGDYISRENQMLLHHLRRGLPLRVFEQQRQLCRYLGEFTVDQEAPVASWVRTGVRKPVSRSSDAMWEVQFPLLRLRQLTGGPCFDTAAAPHFEQAPQMDLDLLLSGAVRTPRVQYGAQKAAEESTDAEEGRRSLKRLLGIVQRAPQALDALGALDDAQALAALLQLVHRKAGLAELRQVAEDPHALERDLQRVLQGQFWIFGGQFAGEAARRRLVPGDEVDIPLIRGDGTLQIVEIKRSMALRGSLVKRHRSGWVPSAQVHDAVGQALNYLVHLDEHRLRIRDQFGLEARRARALVLIGHPAAQPGVPEGTINDVLRTLNTHLGRIEVLTYKELLDNAERSLGDFTD
ncbi:Shedu anti-phage system protein SduA domain-containing protein [Streptomyces sp. NPDC051243]|uniref:Shedu anti-phage system protein SduA domain-containing protein n=1 Tax=Streptomyces sp. NPDC051243 TaxID=3365646 RepID=UPI0037B36D00